MGIHDELPEPFVCVICKRLTEASPWHWHKEHKPPICNYCGTAGGHRARFPGMTRGDHRQMQRLQAITYALAGQAMWIKHGWQ